MFKEKAKEEFIIPGEAAIWLGLVFISLISTVLALRLLSFGIRLLGPANAAVLNTIEPLTSVLAGVLFYGETLSLSAVLGCGFVIISVLLIALDSRRLKRKSVPFTSSEHF
ncbi:MAG: EamA family transporter [Firmicutes bacterium]|nr:EamA family transporter [Bacillota bacterium]